MKLSCSTTTCPPTTQPTAEEAASAMKTPDHESTPGKTPGVLDLRLSCNSPGELELKFKSHPDPAPRPNVSATPAERKFRPWAALLVALGLVSALASQCQPRTINCGPYSTCGNTTNVVEVRGLEHV